MQTLDYCAVTHDTWTSIATQNYGALTVHYITPEWTLRSLCLETKEYKDKHSAENLARHIKASQNEWGFPTPTGVSDSAANETKAFSLLKWNRVACFGHNLNLAVKSALKEKSAADILARGRRVVQYFHKSTTAANALKRMQQQHLSEEHWNKKLIQDVPTRWNSSFAMLQRLIEQSKAIHATLLEPNIKHDAKNLYSFEDQRLVDAMLDFLKPFKDATTIMSTEEAPSLPALYPTYVQLVKNCTVSDNDLQPLQSMKLAAKSDLDKRYVDSNPAILIASFLHPRTKHLRFLTEEKRLEIHNFVREELLQTVENVAPPTLDNHAVPDETKDQPKKKAPKIVYEDFMDCLDDIIKPLENDSSVADNLELVNRELNRYISEPSV